MAAKRNTRRRWCTIVQIITSEFRRRSDSQPVVGLAVRDLPRKTQNGQGITTTPRAKQPPSPGEGSGDRHRHRPRQQTRWPGDQPGAVDGETRAPPPATRRPFRQRPVAAGTSPAEEAIHPPPLARQNGRCSERARRRPSRGRPELLGVAEPVSSPSCPRRHRRSWCSFSRPPNSAADFAFVTFSTPPSRRPGRCPGRQASRESGRYRCPRSATAHGMEPRGGRWATAR